MAKDKWDDLTRQASGLIGPDKVKEIIGDSKDDADRFEKLLAAVIVAAREESKGQKSHFESQLRRSERLATIGQMAAAIVHEINNPLGALSGFIQLMIAEYPDPDRGLGFLDEMSSEVRRILGTTDRLLDFSRHTLGGTEARRQQVDLGSLIPETLDLLMPQVRFSKVVVNSEVAEDIPPIMGNADELKQVFMNLLLNAIQAMPTGGQLSVQVTSDEAGDDDVPPQPAPRRATDPPSTSYFHLRQDPPLEPTPVPTWTPGSTVVRVVITDSGMGIRQENLGLIFDPFFTTKGRGEGTGLGLSTSLGIVNSHGGAIRVISQQGKGTTFTVTVPADRSAS